MVEYARKISLGALLVALICFFLPFTELSCQGQKVTSLTGIQLVTGTTLSQPRPFGPPKKTKMPSEPLAVVAFVCAGLAMAFAVLRNRMATIISAVVSAAGAVTLLLLKSKIDSDIMKEGQGVLQVGYLFPYWLALLLYVAASVLNGYAFTQRAKQVSADR